MNKHTEEILQGIEENFLQMPYNKMLWLRLEFMAICEDEIEALILRVMEYEIEGLRHIWLRKAQEKALQGKPIPEEPEHWWVSLSYKQFMVRLYGVIKNKKTIIEKLNKLINDKHFLLRRTNPDNEYGAPQYTINKKEVQDKLDQLPPLSPLKAAAKSVENEVKHPVPASGTPTTKEETTDPYQLVVPPIPVGGTPHTSSWYTPVPVGGGGVYQPLVPVNNSNKKSINNNKETTECNVATAHADVASTSHTALSLSEKKEAKENPTPQSTTEQGVTPPTKKEIAPRRSPASKKNKSSKKNETADLLALSEIPAPQKPDPATQGYNVELFMKLADYYRGSELAKSNNPNSRYQKALNAAMALVQRKAPFDRVDKLFCFMLGRGEEIGRPKLIDQKWIDGCYPTDLWVVENHYTDKWLECQRLEQVSYGIAPNAKQSKSSGEGMTHDEAQEVARDAIAKGKQYGYSIKAQAMCEQGVWLVKIDWDGDPLTMRSSAEWEKTFSYNYEEDQKELALMKGAN